MNFIKPNWQPTHLQDTFVQLAPVQENDFERLYAVAKDPGIWEQHPDRLRWQEDVFRKFFQGALESHGAFVILDVASQSVIGSTRFYNYVHADPSICIGYTFLARAYWGTNRNKNCKKLLLDYAFKYVDTVYFEIGEKNIRSQKAIEKIGAVRTGVTNLGSLSAPSNHIRYSINKNEFHG